MEITVGSEITKQREDRLQNLERKKLLYNYFFIAFFLLVVALQSWISFDKDISIRIEFGTQAIFDLFTIIMMVIASYNLFKTIERFFGTGNNSFRTEVG